MAVSPRLATAAFNHTFNNAPYMQLPLNSYLNFPATFAVPFMFLLTLLGPLALSGDLTARILSKPILNVVGTKNSITDFLVNMSASADVLVLAKVEVDLTKIPEL